MSTLAEKVDHLFRTVRPGDGKAEYTYEQVAAGCRKTGGPTISGAYVWMLRNGKRDNPTMKHVQALAGFFGVHPTYFFDDDREPGVTMSNYYVEVPTRGVQVYCVEASSAAEAERLVNEHREDAEPVDYRVTWSGLARHASTSNT